MATEAFDPFAVDEDDDDYLFGAATTPPRHSNVRYSPKVIPSPRSSPRPRDASNTSVAFPSPRGKRTAAPDQQINDILGFFNAALLPGAFNDDDVVDEFGFPSVDFAAAFEGVVDEAHARDTSSTHPGRPSLEGVTFILAEEMSLIHKSKTNKCSVKVRGNLSVRTLRVGCCDFFRQRRSHRNFTLHPSSFFSAGGTFRCKSLSAHILRRILS